MRRRKATIHNPTSNQLEQADSLEDRVAWLSHPVLSGPPFVAITALAFVAAGNTLWASSQWRTVRGVVLWSACVLILIARVRLADVRVRFAAAAPRIVPSAARWWRREILTASFIGMALSIVLLAGEILPADGAAARNSRLILLAPASVLLLADWRRVRRALLAKSLRSADQSDANDGDFAVEHLLFQVTWIATCWLAILAIANALWGHHELWVTARPFVHYAFLIAFAILWRSHGRPETLVSRLRHVARDEYRRVRSLRRQRAKDGFRRVHHLSRNWAANQDAGRDRSPSTALVIDALALDAGMRVADVGTGGGYFAVRIAERVGSTGHVLATDVSAEFVARLRERASAEGLSQLRVCRVDAQQLLPDVAPLDRVLFANVYLFSMGDEAQARAWLERLARALVPGGKLILYSDFVHDAGWIASPEWPPLAVAEADPQALLKWSEEWFDLDANIPLPPPLRRLAPHERAGYLLVLRRSSRPLAAEATT